MFSALETTWDQSARRRWTTVASFTMQALGLSLLLAIPLLTVQGPPRLEWTASNVFSPPPVPASPAPPNAQRAIRSSNMSGEHLLQPPAIPSSIAPVNDNNTDVPTAPEIGDIAVQGGTGQHGPGVLSSIGDQITIAPPPRQFPRTRCASRIGRNATSSIASSRTIQRSRGRRAFRDRSSCARSSARTARLRTYPL